MKNRIFTLVVFLLASIVIFAQSNFHNIHYLDPYNPEYVKGEVLIKFKDEVQVESSTRSGVAKTGIISVDVLLEPYQIETIDKVFKETRDQRQRKTVKTIRDFKGNEIEVPALFNIYKLKFDTIWDAKQIIEELQKDKNVEFAEPNYLVYTNEVMESGIVPKYPPIQTPLPSITGDRDTYPNDPLYQDGSQWYLDAINAPAAWDSVTGDTTQIIAIIDTGVDWDHPDLDDNIWTNWHEIPDNGIDDDNNGYIDDTRGWDFINNDNDPNDDNSHGTHVAGIAAAEGNNGIGICGVAWNSQIMPIKMLQSSGTGNSTDFASAIEYAADNGATVINMSLGSYGESQVVKIACENAYAGTGDGEGSMLVAAAGNNHKKVSSPDPCRTYGLVPMPMFPGAYSWVIGVMAEDAGPCGGFSNWDFDGPIAFEGFNYEIQAKGVGIISCKPNGSYWTKSGTSMASPEVAGAVALMRQYNPDDSGEQIFAKLIQGSNSGLIDIYGSLTASLVPNLYYIDYTIVDTLPGCDNDGIADAGETIQLYLTIKNAGGQADSVWSKIRFGEFEDTTTAVVVDSTSYIGSMSAYSTMSGLLSPFKIEIDNEIAHNRDIVFEYEIAAKNYPLISGELIIKVQNAIELGGFITEDLTLYPNKLYLVVESLLIDDDAKLTINPGTELKFSPQKSIKILGTLDARGNPDSLIKIQCDNPNSWGGQIRLESSQQDTSYLQYIQFYRMSAVMFYYGQAGPIVFTNNIIEESNRDDYMFFSQFDRYLKLESNLFLNNYGNNSYFSIRDNQTFKHNLIISNGLSAAQAGIYTRGGWDQGAFSSNTFINNNYSAVKANDGNGSQDHSGNYWGTSDSTTITESITDYFDFPYLMASMFWPFLDAPSPFAHGHVWKININNILINKIDNPYNSATGLGVIGSETLKFDVYFNRAMDTSFTPLLTFGVREPYTQHIVADSASWSADSAVWTAYKTIAATTGDGIQRVRVASARDDEYFEIPIEDSRFEFVIQSASAASIEFYATPGIGKVELEWPPSPSEDLLGYNLYRFYNLTDSTFSDTLRINTELILDTLYTDFNIIPDTTYHYLYTTLGTDMTETDFSKKVTATPFDAANGDANGDLAVNVLDITTIVAFMLNQNPSPFLFDAADVNYDDEINVLDIIGLVQLINGKKNLSIQPLPECSKEIAYYNIKNNKLLFESKGNVAALQFKIKVRSQKLGVGSRKSQQLENLKIFSLINGFEFSYGVVGDEIIGILYSMSSKELPQGIIDLFRFEGVDVNNIEIIEIFGGDLNGDYVPVLKKGENASIIDSEAVLNVSPNPFTNSTQINYSIPVDGIVSLRLFNLNGTEVEVLTNSYHHSGNHAINWNGTNSKGQLLKPGIYLLQLKIKSVSGNKYNKELKVVLVK